MMSTKDEPDAKLPPAVDGLLRVHKRTTDGLDVEPDQPQRGAPTVGPTWLLVPAFTSWQPDWQAKEQPANPYKMLQSVFSEFSVSPII
jgi:hypothetical protein